MPITIATEQTLYTFDELDDDGKNRAAEWVLEDPYFFWTDMDAEKSYHIDSFFTHGLRPDAEYNFAFSQGDGYNLFGTLDYNDLRAVAGLEPLNLDVTVKIPANHTGYSYSMWNMDNYKEETLWAIEQECGYGFAQVQERNVKHICEAMHKLCTDMYAYGEYLILDAYRTESSIYEGWLFDEGGNYVCGTDEAMRKAG